MTNLTEQLATESLPEYTEFYVRKKDGSTDTKTWLNRRHSSAVEWWNTFNITEVIAPVPSYEEWKLMQDDNKRLKHDVGNLGYKIKNQRKEIDNRLKEIEKLKELLKECREVIKNVDTYYGNYDSAKGYLVINKIEKELEK